MIEIGRAEVQRLVAEAGAQLVEVLPAEEFDDEHLPGAVNIPLAELADRAGKELDSGRPVIVYCFDTQCDLSPRAAWRLESLGFEQVHDYVAGKEDWAAADLPTEGRALGEPRVGRLARRDVPRCRLDETVAAVTARLGDWALGVVVNDDGVVLGVVRAETVRPHGERRVAEVMREGPSTYRPNVPAAELAERLDRAKVPRVLITTSAGRLIGLVQRDDLPATG